MDGPDLSSTEIRALLQKLNPSNGGKHTDRVRRLARFRNYVESGAEFYDDDLLLLFAGDPDEREPYSLLRAAGEPSKDHRSALKRSAKNAMALVRFLVCDMDDETHGFRQALASLSADELRVCRFDMHLTATDAPAHHVALDDKKRSGSREDAGMVAVAVLTDLDSSLRLKELLPEDAAREEFLKWVRTNIPDVLEAVENAGPKAPVDMATASGVAAQLDLPYPFPAGVIGTPASGHAIPKRPTRWADSRIHLEEKKAEPDEKAEAEAKQKNEQEKAKQIGKDPLGLRGEEFDLRFMQANKTVLIEEALKHYEEEKADENQFHGNSGGGLDDQLFGLQARREGFINVIEQSAQRKYKQLRRKQKAMASQQNLVDPDAVSGQDSKRILDNADDDLDYDDDEFRNRDYDIDDVGSILPIDEDFDPMLFLTLVHREASFDQLQDALKRLNNKTDDHIMRLQSIVRDNFALFIRCADGIDIFSESDGNGSSRSSSDGALLPEQLARLDKLAEDCAHQAKSSFKPLLDNTAEVRKTQAALALLQRVSSLLQVPQLMRQHIEASDFTAAIKAYRRILVIDDDCRIDLLRIVKHEADQAAREARDILVGTLGDDHVPVDTLLDAVRDLGALHDLTDSCYTPAAACLRLQIDHFADHVSSLIAHTDDVSTRLFQGDTTALQDLYNDVEDPDATTVGEEASVYTSATTATSATSPTNSRRKKKWRYDILEARVKATVQAVSIARKWLNRLMRVGVTAMEAERRHAARIGQKKTSSSKEQEDKEPQDMSPNDMFVSQVMPSLKLLVNHATFCALGCSNTSGSNSDGQVRMTFGQDAAEGLVTLLRTPLPPRETAICATEVADLYSLVNDFEQKARSLWSGTMSEEGDSATAVKMAVVAMERRRCIYAYHVCARNCTRRASGSGNFDGAALLECVRGLGSTLTRPMDCANEVEKGCQMVVLKCREGLTEYVRDRGSDAARLKAVAECASVLAVTVPAVVREVETLTNGSCEDVGVAMENEISGLENLLFNEFLSGVRKSVQGCIKLGFLDYISADDANANGGGQDSGGGDRDFDFGSAHKNSFPGYLSASLLAIVRCRARVEKALGGSTQRKADEGSASGRTYLDLTMTTASECLFEKLCKSINNRAMRMTGGQAERLANELRFLLNTLGRYLGPTVMEESEKCFRLLCSKVGGINTGIGALGRKNTDVLSLGPDGLQAIEELERLGRVYVMCLGD